MLSIKIPFFVLASWFYKENFKLFSMQEEQLWFFICVLFLITLYFVIKPLINLFSRLGWNFLSTYLITILLFGNVILIIKNQQYINVGPSSTSFVLLSIVTLGMIVMIVRISQLIFIYLKQK